MFASKHAPRLAPLTVLAALVALSACDAGPESEFELDRELELELELDDELELELESDADIPEAGPSGIDSGIDEEHTPALAGIETQGFEPVVRIATSLNTACTATAIAHDMLVTAAHCVKSDNNLAEWVEVIDATGDNDDAEGATSGYLLMSGDMLNNVSIPQQGVPISTVERDIAFIKFGRKTFTSHYQLTDSAGLGLGTPVFMVGYGGNNDKASLPAVPLSGVIPGLSGEYAIGTVNTASFVESGDSGGPLLVIVNGEYAVAGVLFGFSGSQSLYPLITPELYDHVGDMVTGDIRGYCVEAHQHSNYDGRSWSMCHGLALRAALASDNQFQDTFSGTRFDDESDWNDRFSSVRIPADVELTLYQHGNKTGDQVVWPASSSKQLVSHLSDHDFNDRASSFKVRYYGP